MTRCLYKKKDRISSIEASFDEHKVDKSIETEK